ncbi:hypothetical protein AGDE_08674 [Angomonas deanei]|uniref:Guanine nucleotide-binding protein subunit beta-like protein n=1 Tax=Angomonas deanei TaxID=59799 RepID=A0A7G2CK75_9TRYP|nr:hypothetical protein AGDE_08674 [Angomonas deanei]CAD2219361.1 hypothetical protein, conserved [Angomonas deanei]|eukprot:EPY32459.1 hypothetical protein AGDE_08674 [Angomonas deanei]
MPYTPNGVESSDDNTAVCVVASYSSAVQDIFGGNGGVDMSAVNGESLAEILHLTSGQLPTEAGLTDYGYNWGSYNNSGNPFRNIAGSLTSREWSIERVVSISKASPGLVMAWLTIPVCDEQADETDGLMASKMVIVATPLVCDSEVTSLVIHPYRPNTVFGGTRSGRLVSWTVGTDVLSLDTRHLRSQATATSGAKHILVSFPRRPSFSTYPSPQAHQGPVLKIAVMGDSNSHHLYSVSQDGKVCTWISSQPLHPHTSRTAYIGNKAMGSVGLRASFSTMKGSDAMSKVFIGTAGGALLYGSNRDARALELHYMKNNPVASASSNKESPSTSGVWGKYGEAPSMSANSEESSKGNLFSNPVTRASEHGGIVTAVAVQPEVFGLRDSECVLSAASDGSCYAWLEDYAVRLDGFGDVVCALEWSPTMPTLFAAGDASGTLSLWDVSQSITSPIASVSLTHHFSAQTGATPISTVVGIRKGVSDLQGDFDEDDTEDMFHYNKTSGREKNLADEEVSSRITALHFSYSGRWLFAGTAGGFVYAVELSQEFYKE